MTELYRPEIHKELLDIANTPIMQNLLYDLDLLPEQLEAQKEMTIGLFAAYNRMQGILIAFKYLQLEQTERRKMDAENQDA